MLFRIVWAAALVVGAAACDRTGTELTQDLLGCAFGAAIVPVPGEVATLSDGDPSTNCVAAPDGGDFALVLFLSGPTDEEFELTARVTGGGFGALDDTISAGAVPSATVVDGVEPSALREGELFELLLREREASELGWRLLDRRQGLPASAEAGAGAGALSVGAGRAPPAVGTMLELNVGASCDVIDRRSGRVSLVTDHAIVVEDESNPDPGLSPSDIGDIGRRFDNLIYPTLTDVWGEPPDIDDNDRVIVFLSRGVNEKAIFGGVVAGFFWAGDLFPRSESDELPACRGSNEGEVLYLAVPDEQGAAGTPRTVDAVRRTIMSTAGHELQHLLNAGRRIHVNGAQVLEERWLNEGLSYVAEELLFYAASGAVPGQNLGAADLLSGPLSEPFDEFGRNNVGRYNIYLQQPHLSSPVDRDRLTTRGAAWAFLRYVADRDPGPDSDLFNALLNSTTSGLDNIGDAIHDEPLQWMADWSVSVFSDDLASGESVYEQPSWDFRGLIPPLRDDGLFPLRLRTITSGAGLEETLRPAGAASYTVFRLEPDGRALIEVSAEQAPGGRVRAFLVRVR